MKKKLSTKVADHVMQLDFFAKRFGYNANIASWSVVCSYNEDGEETVAPVVYVGDDLYVDILADDVRCLVNVGGCRSVVKQAIVRKVRGGYKFEFDDRQKTYFVASSQIYDLYKNKFVYSWTPAEAKCLNM